MPRGGLVKRFFRLVEFAEAPVYGCQPQMGVRVREDAEQYPQIPFRHVEPPRLLERKRSVG